MQHQQYRSKWKKRKTDQQQRHNNGIDITRELELQRERHAQSVSSSDVAGKQETQKTAIPGFYYDEDKCRYFPTDTIRTTRSAAAFIEDSEEVLRSSSYERTKCVLSMLRSRERIGATIDREKVVQGIVSANIRVAMATPTSMTLADSSQRVRDDNRFEKQFKIEKSYF